MTSVAAAVEANGLVKTYPKGVRALDGLSISVRPGEVFALLGPNGAGKSTTIKILTTLTRPDAGSVTVAGHDALAHPERVRRVIGVVAQRSGADPAATTSCCTAACTGCRAARCASGWPPCSTGSR